MMHINDSYIIYSSTSQLVLNEFFIDFNDLVSLESFVEKNTLFSSVAPWRESIVVIFCVHINYIYSLSNQTIVFVMSHVMTHKNEVLFRVV